MKLVVMLLLVPPLMKGLSLFHIVGNCKLILLCLHGFGIEMMPSQFNEVESLSSVENQPRNWMAKASYITKQLFAIKARSKMCMSLSCSFLLI